MLDLDQIKSAKVIEDPGEIGALLRARGEAEGGVDRLSVDEGGEVLGRTFGSLAPSVGLATGIECKAIPKPPKGDALRELVESRGLPWDEAYAERSVPYVASDESVDSYGDIVKQNWKLDDFWRNPVMPFAHEWGGLPVGNIVEAQVVSMRRRGYTGPALWLLGVFATAEVSEFADQVHRLVRSGMLRSGSVGFASKRVINITDDAERKKLGLGQYGLILDDNHLREFSPTLMGANGGATALLNHIAVAKSRGLEAGDQALVMELSRQAIRAAGQGSDSWRDFRRALGATWRSSFPDARPIDHEDLGAPLERFAAMADEAALRDYAPAAPTSDDEPEVITISRADFDNLQARLGAAEEGLHERIDRLEAEIEQARVRSDPPEGSEPAGEGDAGSDSGDEGDLEAQIRNALNEGQNGEA